MVAFLNPFHILPVREEFLGHGARLVCVKINADMVAFGALHKIAKILQTDFMVHAEFRKQFAGSELTQDRVYPNPIHTQIRQFLQQAVRVRVEPRVH